MLRSAVFGLSVLVVAAACGGAAPPTAAPGGPTAAPTSGPTSAPAPNVTPGTPAPNVTPGLNALPGGDSWAASAASYGTPNGTRYLFTCPPNGTQTSIWGTDIYTNDSSVCNAAVHAGLITYAAGGAVTIELRPGQEQYIGSTRNGVTSSNYASWSQSFVFVSGQVVVPTPSAAPGAGYGADTLLFSDDFSDTSGGWATETGPNGTIAYESEKLAIDLAANVSYISTSGLIDSTAWDVVRVEATLTATGGNAANYVGLLCGRSAEDAAGAVVGTDGVYAFIRRTGTNYEALEYTQGLAGSSLQNDVPARLTLECAGMSTGMLRLRLSFDGRLIDEYSDDAGPQSFQTVSVYVEGKAGAGYTIDDVAVFGGDAAGLPPMATGEMAELLTHVPAAFNVNCHEVTTLSAGEIVSVSCTPSSVTGYITYTLFDTEAHAQEKWFGDLDFFGEGAEGPDCDSGPCVVAWERDGLVEGRYFANSYASIDPNGLIAYWFDSGLMIEAGMAVHDTTFAELYSLALQAGPIP